MVSFLCENCFDGILCGVYDAYESRLAADNCRLEIRDEYDPELFVEYRQTELSGWKAKKVLDTILRKMTEETYVFLYRASLHKDPERADRIYRFIRTGLIYGKNTIHMIQRPEIYEIFQMNRYVWNEAHLLTGFVRFKRLASGMFIGSMSPENNVLEVVAGHFADRLSGENWLLYDEKRGRAALHTSDGNWAVAAVSLETMKELENQEEDGGFSSLWKSFFDSIAIQERKNLRCQRSFLPLRYREYMTEFQCSDQN